MQSLTLITIVAFVALGCWFLLLMFLMKQVLLAKSVGKRVGVLFLLLFALAGVPFLMGRPLLQVPPTQGIAYSGVIEDAASGLRVTGIRMAVPDYGQPEGETGRTFAAIVEVDVENTSDVEQVLTLDYYAEGGSMVLYSSGAASGEYQQTIAAGASETQKYRVAHVHFLRGGYLRLAFSVGPPSDTGREPFFEETFPMLEE
jgi:hypothetical protein